jgi:hypothetical protein
MVICFLRISFLQQPLKPYVVVKKLIKLSVYCSGKEVLLYCTSRFGKHQK